MGLIKTAAKVAVASSVHGRVQRRQQTRWAAQDQAHFEDHRAPVAPPPAAQAPANGAADQLAQLKLLGELRDSGVLTDAEFETKKAQILGT